MVATPLAFFDWAIRRLSSPASGVSSIGRGRKYFWIKLPTVMMHRTPLGWDMIANYMESWEIMINSAY
jgi:hypothetical protein